MSVLDVESQLAHSFARTPGFADGHLAERDEAMQYHATVQQGMETCGDKPSARDILKLLTRTNLN